MSQKQDLSKLPADTLLEGFCNAWQRASVSQSGLVIDVLAQHKADRAFLFRDEVQRRLDEHQRLAAEVERLRAEVKRSKEDVTPRTECDDMPSPF